MIHVKLMPEPRALLLIMFSFSEGRAILWLQGIFFPILPNHLIATSACLCLFLASSGADFQLLPPVGTHFQGSVSSWSWFLSSRFCGYSHSNMALYFFFPILIFTLFYFTILYWFCHIDMNLPRMYMSSPSWTPLSLPSPCHPSGSSQCPSPKHTVSCIEPGLAIHFLYETCII